MKILKGLPGYFQLTGGFSPARPLYLMLNLETPCRYSCLKCALPGCGCGRVMGPPLSLTERKRVIQIAQKTGVKALVIIGAGEPTDKHGFPIVRPVVECAAELGMTTILFTTLYGLTGQQADFFKKHDVSLYVSLDSLDSGVYRKLTGSGRLERILPRIELLRRLYKPETAGADTIVRLGINTTVNVQNYGELERIRAFAGDDMHYVANYPIRRGRFAQSRIWQELVGYRYEEIKRRAHDLSETGGPTSVAEGVCSYFFRGVSVEIDGQLLVCGYAGETGDCFGNVRQWGGVEDLLRHWRRIQGSYSDFVESCGRSSPCPLRDEVYPRLLTKFNDSPFRILS